MVMQPNDFDVTDEDLDKLAREPDYYFPILIAPHKWACIARRITHYDIISGGKRDVDIGWADQWSYKHLTSAVTALMDWRDFKTAEPQGWHRHLPSNRRIDSEGKVTIAP
jgi:hypothetical protein